MLINICYNLFCFPPRKLELSSIKADIDDNIASLHSIKSVKLAKEAHLFFTGLTYNEDKKTKRENLFPYRAMCFCLYAIYAVFLMNLSSMIFFNNPMNVGYFSLFTLTYAILIGRHSMRKIKTAMIIENIRQIHINCSQHKIKYDMQDFYRAKEKQRKFTSLKKTV